MPARSLSPCSDRRALLFLSHLPWEGDPWSKPSRDAGGEGTALLPVLLPALLPADPWLHHLPAARGLGGTWQR